MTIDYYFEYVSYCLSTFIHCAHRSKNFLKLKLLKNYLRSKISQEWPNGLATLYIKKILLDKIDIGAINNDFTWRHIRRSFKITIYYIFVFEMNIFMHV
jgi:hypothetical protein